MQLTFYVSYIIGFLCCTGFVARYHILTKGAWRKHPAGISIFGMAVSLAVTLSGVVIRVVLLRMLGWDWADTPTKVMVLLGLFAVIAFILHRWYLLERYQRSDKE